MLGTKFGIYILILSFCSACLNGPKFFHQEGTLTQKNGATTVIAAAVKKDEDGILTAALDASSNVTQSVTASVDSKIAGTTVTFPPGSLGISTDITIEEGAGLVSSSLQDTLGSKTLADVQAEGRTVVLTPATPMDAAAPFTVSLALPASLRLTERYYIVVYRVSKAGQSVDGVVPTSKVSLANGKASFSIQYFGAYQLASVASPLTEELADVATEQPIETAAQVEAKPPTFDELQPFVATPGATVTIKGVNIRPTMTLALGGRSIDKIQVKSDVSASFTMPDDAQFGFTDLTIDQDGTKASLKLFAKTDGTGLPLITMDVSGVCFGVKFIDANGAAQVGTKVCEAGSSVNNDVMLKSVYDTNGDGTIEQASRATTAGASDAAEYSQYSLGSQGTGPLTAAASLAIPTSGSFFVVSGFAQIQALTNGQAGRRVTLQFLNSCILKHSSSSPKLDLLSKGIQVIPAGEVIEFLATSSSDWKQINQTGLVGGNEVHGLMDNAGMTVTGSGNVELISWTATNLIDPVGQMNGAGTTFTALTAGTYAVEAGIYVAFGGSPVTASCSIKLTKNGSDVASSSYTSNSSSYCSPGSPVTTSVNLNAGETLTFYSTVNFGGASSATVYTNGSFRTYFSIKQTN